MVRPNFDTEAVRRYLQQQSERIEKAVIELLKRIGEEGVGYARSKTKNEGGFGDRTGNLRSSISYCILKNGEVIFGGKPEVVKGGAEGAATARRQIEEAKSRFPKGLVLIITAGMSYASYVESGGRDVLTGSSLLAKQSLRVGIERIKGKLAA